MTCLSFVTYVYLGGKTTLDLFFTTLRYFHLVKDNMTDRLVYSHKTVAELRVCLSRLQVCHHDNYFKHVAFVHVPTMLTYGESFHIYS